jgi:hypothetical protein
MENKIIKLLCTSEEASIIESLELISFIKSVQYDPNWGLTGSGEYYVVYLDNSNNILNSSFMFELGMAVAMKKAGNLTKAVFNTH